jgi:hypothetical protein
MLALLKPDLMAVGYDRQRVLDDQDIPVNIAAVSGAQIEQQGFGDL